MHRPTLFLLPFLTSCLDGVGVPPTAPFDDATTDGLSWTFLEDLGDTAVGLAHDGTTTWALVDGQVLQTTDAETWQVLPGTGLPGEPLLWIGTAGGTVHVEADGVGLMRWTGTEWTTPSSPPPPSSQAPLYF